MHHMRVVQSLQRQHMLIISNNMNMHHIAIYIARYSHGHSGHWIDTTQTQA